jgi:hypothetical protein
VITAGIAPALRLPLSRTDWNGRAATEIAEDSSETRIAQALIRQRRINDEIEGELGWGAESALIVT